MCRLYVRVRLLKELNDYKTVSTKAFSVTNSLMKYDRLTKV